MPPAKTAPPDVVLEVLSNSPLLAAVPTARAILFTMRVAPAGTVIADLISATVEELKDRNPWTSQISLAAMAKRSSSSFWSVELLLTVSSAVLRTIVEAAANVASPRRKVVVLFGGVGTSPLTVAVATGTEIAGVVPPVDATGAVPVTAVTVPTAAAAASLKTKSKKKRI